MIGQAEEAIKKQANLSQSDKLAGHYVRYQVIKRPKGCQLRESPWALAKMAAFRPEPQCQRFSSARGRPIYGYIQL
ncbi:hypothetical protein Dhaf_4670 [Desulfitobacterium hafniense DCB-2]|uniref:Uncharacterized protein n=1 Tax=Desulfitobacterium hafniense (strain DSM 10664 / DCB-2) TaxID=272564 RepID=B8FXR6_DESHD|nr:hypothetical protein Dhaf_4670 [Desulfitobacterium hafniense DCB-2]